MDAVDRGRARAGESRPGIVAAAVLRAACLSARMSEAFIARASGVSADTIRSWADGSCALASVPVPQLERLEGALLTAGAEPSLVADLSAAAWCDLVLAAITAGEDITVLLADPAASSDTFTELLGWAVADRVPARYRLSKCPSHHSASEASTSDAIRTAGTGSLRWRWATHRAQADDQGSCTCAPAALQGILRRFPALMAVFGGNKVEPPCRGLSQWRV